MRHVQVVAAFLWGVLIAGCGGPVAAPALESGRAIAFGAGPSAREACFSCHGFEGEGSAAAPRLAGQSGGYLAKQLEDYANATRPDAVMTPIAARLSHAERRAVSDYFASLGAARAAPRVDIALYRSPDHARGLAACVTCHREGVEALGAPRLGGQSAQYTREQFRRWRYGVRRNDPEGVMSEIARALSEEEIEAFALQLERIK